jgi:uncharacterized protein
MLCVQEAEVSNDHGERIELQREAGGAHGRYRTLVDGRQVAELDFTERDGLWDITHTYADPAFRGSGLAGRLVRYVMDAARDAQVGIRPSCPYIPVWLSRNPEYADLVRP